MTTPLLPAEREQLATRIAVARCIIKNPAKGEPSENDIGAELRTMHYDEVQGVYAVPRMTATAAAAYLKSVGSPVPAAPKK